MLLDALLKRRSRRFSEGMEIKAGPTAYNSGRDLRPLTEIEQAVLVFVTCGITGSAMADWSYAIDTDGSHVRR